MYFLWKSGVNSLPALKYLYYTEFIWQYMSETKAHFISPIDTGDYK